MILEMNLKIKGGWRRVVKWTIWSILAVIFLVFLIRVATFESAYYGEKEGSERAVAEQNIGDDLDETEPTEQEVAEYYEFMFGRTFDASYLGYDLNR